jgi:pyrroloquinoline quinone biosynthesis protein D
MPDEKKPGTIGHDAVPSLPRGVRLKVDEVRGRTVLLGPERTIDLDPVAAAIAGAVDGRKSLAEILDQLCAAYNAPREEIEADVMAFLMDLADRKLMDIKP